VHGDDPFVSSKAPSFAAETGWTHSASCIWNPSIEPAATLWFHLPAAVFFVVAKATGEMPPLMIWVWRRL